MPELLWLLHMGVVLFCVHDRSPGQASTRTLVGRALLRASRHRRAFLDRHAPRLAA